MGRFTFKAPDNFFSLTDFVMTFASVEFNSIHILCQISIACLVQGGLYPGNQENYGKGGGNEKGLKEKSGNLRKKEDSQGKVRAF